jgi:UDP:flavonoid glycosyltransferase YjiC (YdhE family)
LPVRALVTRGPSFAGTPLRVLANAVAVDTAPHDAVMRGTSLVVTHCGHGTVMRALAHHRPMLCLPMGRDLNDNAARVVERGAGLRLVPDADVAAIRKAIGSMMQDAGFVAAASRRGTAVAAAEPQSALGDELEAPASCFRGKVAA